MSEPTVCCPCEYPADVTLNGAVLCLVCAQNTVDVMGTKEVEAAKAVVLRTYRDTRGGGVYLKGRAVPPAALATLEVVG